MQIDQSLTNAITNAIEERVQKNEMFTAFDITLAVQEECRKDGVTHPTHKEIKEFIHDNMKLELSYTSSFVDVGAPTKAKLYYPQGNDPQHYIPKPRNNITSNPTVTPATPQTPLVVVVKKSVTKEGKLTIPASFLRSIGKQTNVAVLALDMSMVLARRLCLFAEHTHAPKTYSVLNKCKVNRYGNIRIAGKYLKHIRGSHEYIITLHNGTKEIIIEPARVQNNAITNN